MFKKEKKVAKPKGKDVHAVSVEQELTKLIGSSKDELLKYKSVPMRIAAIVKEYFKWEEK